jgi:methylenetetrahydrofolate dehydrogenase (NADP+)/methenyltetrahydrofolate cyclohydrolase
MTATLIDGKSIAKELRQEIKQQILDRVNSGKVSPGLAVILVGDDPASGIYVKNKQLACDEVGIFSKKISTPSSITEEDLLELIENLNKDDSIHGILVQLPLPIHINEKRVLMQVHPSKDVDGFHPQNLGKLAQRDPFLQACTPLGVMLMLEKLKIDPKGMNATIIGASQIVGRPMALSLLNAGSTVTVCHRFTRSIKEEIQRADLLVVAAGKPGLVPGEWIKKDAVVIDVGMNRLANGKLVGDVHFEEALKRASYITPVPGGVGPMTVACLLKNTLDAANHIDGIN